MHQHVVLGGTFDHLHDGHKDLISLAFSQGSRVTLGLTKASMNSNKRYAKQIQSYRKRHKELLSFVASIGHSKDISIIPITNVYGTTLQDPTLEAIIVTPHSEEGAKEINTQRHQRGMSSLQIYICNLRKDDTGQILSSTRIREGLCDRHGHLYMQLFSSTMTLSESAKNVLRLPHGKACGARFLRSKKMPIICVGDVVTSYCVKNSIPFCSAYIDGRSKRENFEFTIPSGYQKNELHLSNPNGSIANTITHHIQNSSLHSNRQIWKIDGEEDLLTVAATLVLPLGTYIVYGYPYAPESMRYIQVSERMKQKFLALFL